jgi:hypothetical protein
VLPLIVSHVFDVYMGADCVSAQRCCIVHAKPTALRMLHLMLAERISQDGSKAATRHAARDRGMAASLTRSFVSTTPHCGLAEAAHAFTRAAGGDWADLQTSQGGS